MHLKFTKNIKVGLNSLVLKLSHIKDIVLLSENILKIIM